MLNNDVQKWIKRLVILMFIIVLYFFLKYIGIIKALLDILVALVPLYIAIFVSWLMRPVAKFFHKKLKINYTISCVLAIILNILVVFGLIFSILPEIITQCLGFFSSLSTSIQKLFDSLIKVGLLKFDGDFFKEINGYLSEYNINLFSLIQKSLQIFQENGTDILNGIYASIVNVGNVLMQIVLGYLLAFYLMPDFSRYLDIFVRQFDEKKQEELKKDLVSISKTLRLYLKGLCLDALTLFLLIAVCISLVFGTKVSVISIFVFAFVAAIFNIIPYIGPIVGAIPLVLVIFQQTGLIGMISAIIIIFIVQVIESNVFYPKIVGDSINMRPVTLMTSLLICGSLLGLVGMFISTPLMAIIKIFLVKFKIINEEDI